MFNRNTLFLPVQSDQILRYDLADATAPDALDAIDLSLDVEIVASAMFSNGDLCLLDGKAGRLIRRTQAGVTVWNVDSREADEVPYQLAVDSLDQVWVGMLEGKLARFDLDGNLLNRIDDSDNPVVAASTSSMVVAYNPVSGRFIMVDQVSGTVGPDFNLAEISDKHQPCAVAQLGMVGEKVYVPVRRKLSVSNPGLYEILEVTTEGELLSVLSFTWTRALRGTLCQENGRVWAMDEFSTVFQFLSDLSLAAIFSLESQGRLWAMALSTDAAVLYAVSDGIFGTSRLHVIDPSTGVPTSQDYSGTEIHGGDLTGYLRASVIAEPDVDGLAPTVDSALITGLILPGSPDTTLITGKPGAALDAESVTCSVGTADVEPDGSFAIAGATMAPGNVSLTFSGPGGDTVQVVAVAAHAETATAASFHGTKFGTDGGYLQVSLADGSGPVTTGAPYIRVRDLATGKYWNGSSFVDSNGLFLALTHQAYGLWTYLFNPGVEGNYAAIFGENGVLAFDAVQVTSEKQESAETLSKVNEMQAPGAALLAPASLFNDESTVGGHIVGRLARLQFLTSILTFKAKIVFPKAIEGIAAVVSRTNLKKLDTPLLLFTLVDAVTGDPMDTTGHTVRLRAAVQPGAAPVIDRELEAVDEAHGQYQLRLTTTDTGTAGSFLAEVKDVSPAGVVLTTQSFNLIIAPGL